MTLQKWSGKAMSDLSRGRPSWIGHNCLSEPKLVETDSDTSLTSQLTLHGLLGNAHFFGRILGWLEVYSYLFPPPYSPIQQDGVALKKIGS